MDLAQTIRNVSDFPVEGIQFKDITTLLQDPVAFRASVDAMLALTSMSPTRKNADRGVHVVFICAILQPTLTRELGSRRSCSKINAGERRPRVFQGGKNEAYVCSVCDCSAHAGWRYR